MRQLVRASVDDRDRLATIDRSAGPYAWPETALLRALDHKQVLTIQVDDKAVGFLVEDRILDETTLLHLAVDRKHQGRGHAGWALKAWLADLTRSGQNRCLLEVRAGNRVAIRLYERLGFEEIGRRKGYYSSPEGSEDARVMARRLTDTDSP